MSDGWNGSLISQVIRWFKYLFPEPKMRGDDEVNSWMQELEDYLYSVYRRSELYEAMGAFTRVGLSPGSSVILPWWDGRENRIKCEVPHPKENYHGPYGAYHRKYKLDALTAVKMFMGKGWKPVGEEGLLGQKLSYSLLKAYADGRHADRFEFIRAVYQYDDPILDGQPIRYRNKPWEEFYVEYAASDEQKKNPPLTTAEGGYFTKPHIKWDYEKNTDEFYARTPSWHAIFDIESFEEVERQKIEAGQRNLRPPMWMYKKFKRQWTGNPNNVIYYDSQEANYEPKAIQDGTNWQIGDLQAQQMRRSVERWYQTDFFQLVSQLTAENTGSWPTATQILKLEGEKAVILGPRVGRFTSVLREIDARFFDIELRKGALPYPPPVVEDYFAEKAARGEQSAEIEVEMIGPLTGIQQRAETLGRSAEGLQIIGAYSALDPLMTKKVRLSVQMEKDLESIRWSQDAIVPEDEYQETLMAIADAERQEREASMLAEAAKVAPGLGKPVDDTSILAKIGGKAA
jgi:hypothetical protein